jgi:hypothetical protein
MTLENMRKKQECLLQNKHISLADIEQLYVALLIEAVVAFEAFIEELFYGLLTRKIKPQNHNVNVRVSIKSSLVAQQIVLRERKYIDWLPFENTLKISKIFFTEGRPFTSIASESEEDKNITKCLIVRNALVHQSAHAIKQFQNKILNGLHLMPRERKPKSFLRAEFSANPPTLYYEQLVTLPHLLYHYELEYPALINPASTGIPVENFTLSCLINSSGVR